MEWEFVALRPDGGTVVGPRLQPERIQEWVEEVLAGTLAEEKLANNAKMIPLHSTKEIMKMYRNPWVFNHSGAPHAFRSTKEIMKMFRNLGVFMILELPTLSSV